MYLKLLPRVFELQLLISEILIAIRRDFSGIGVVEHDSGEIGRQ